MSCQGCWTTSSLSLCRCCNTFIRAVVSVPHVTGFYLLFASDMFGKVSVSDVSFERTENSVGKIASILPSCQQLCLHNCGRVSMSTIAKAMALRRFPSLVRIEAIWRKLYLSQLIKQGTECKSYANLLSPAKCSSFRVRSSERGLSTTQRGHERWNDCSLPASGHARNPARLYADCE